MLSAQRACQREAEIDSQYPRIAVLGQVWEGLEGLEGLLEGGHSFTERGAIVGFGTGLPTVSHGLVPGRASQGMVREAVDLLVQPVANQLLQHLHNLGMQGPSPLLEQTAVGHLLGEGVLEGVLDVGQEACLIEELSGLQVSETV